MTEGMQHTIFTERLKLTLIEKADRGSQELAWLHEIKSDGQAQWWRINGASKTLEDTERGLKDILPLTNIPRDDAHSSKGYRVLYAIHEILGKPSSNQVATPSRFIGLISLRSIEPSMLALPPDWFPITTTPYLTLELSYQYLPSSWFRGFATESLLAVFSACRQAKCFWAPWEKVYIRAIVNEPNKSSLRVVEKLGMKELGLYVWEGEEVWLGGKWTGREELRIRGYWLIE